MNNIKDMPKLKSPFERGDVNGKHKCLPIFCEDYHWILNPEKVIATEKFDGTNVSVIIEDGDIKYVLNRTNKIDLWKSKEWFYNGIKRAIDEKKFNPNLCSDGQYFGELIGSKIQGNPYGLDSPLWLPFDYVKKHYAFKFYNNWLKEKKLNHLENVIIGSKEPYNDFSELFKELKSLWFRKRGLEKSPEGIVFYNKDNGDMCKLRCDMFDWYIGKEHNWWNKNDKEKL